MRLCLTVLILFLISCGGSGKPVFIPEQVAPLSIRVYPAIAPVQSTIRLTCQLPADAKEGIFIFGVSDLFTSGGPIDRLQIQREIMTPCQDFTVFCGYQEHKGKPVMIRQDVKPTGECGSK